MNIVRLVHEFPAAGEVRLGLGPTFYHLSKEQAKLGLGVHVVCKRFHGQGTVDLFDGVHVHRVETPYNLRALTELRKLSRQIDVRLVHSHATSCPSYALFKEFCDQLTHVAHVHGTSKGVMAASKEFIPDLTSSPSEALTRSISILRENIVWRRADAVIAVSGSVLKELTGLYGLQRKNIYVVGNGVDPDIFYPRRAHPALLKRLGVEPDAPKILYTGGFRPMKGAIFLIKALKKARKAVPRLSTIFLGQPRGSRFAGELLHLIKSMDLGRTIRMIKPVPYVEMPQYYSIADALVVPSVYEAFGKVALEALACGVPVVGFPVGGLSEVVTNKRGILVGRGDVDALSEAIVDVVLTPDFKRRIVEQERRSLLRVFSWRNVAESVSNIYRMVLG